MKRYNFKSNISLEVNNTTMEREQYHWKELNRPQENSSFLALAHTCSDVSLAKEFTTSSLKVVDYQTEKMVQLKALAVNPDELTSGSRTHFIGGDNGSL